METTLCYSITWLQKAKIEAKKIKLDKKYHKIKLENLASQIPQYTYKKNRVEEFLYLLQNAGVKFFILSHLKKTYLDGATFKDGDNPVLVYTIRHNRIDNFWFVVAHEIAHILLHINNNKPILDNMDNLQNTDIEKEANLLANKFLKTYEVIKEGKKYKKYFSENRLNYLSEKFNMDISLILGILQYFKIIDYRRFNKYKKEVLQSIPDYYIKG